jgi:hypothetical protein
MECTALKLFKRKKTEDEVKKQAKKIEEEAKKTEVIINKIAETAVQYSMGTAAILFLSVAKPFSIIGSALFMEFTAVFKWIFGNSYDDIVRVMENRDNFERIITKIEELESGKK